MARNRKLGFELAEATVSKYLITPRRAKKRGDGLHGQKPGKKKASSRDRVATGRSTAADHFEISEVALPELVIVLSRSRAAVAMTVDRSMEPVRAQVRA